MRSAILSGNHDGESVTGWGTKPFRGERGRRRAERVVRQEQVVTGTL